MSSARWARLAGRGAARSGATTAGSCCSGPAGRCSARRWTAAGATPSGRRASATTPSGSCSRGAAQAFYREIHAAAGGGSDRDVLDALWDLVWAGEVTNDTFAPLRALRWRRPVAGPATPAVATHEPRATGSGRPMVAGRCAGHGRREPTRPRGPTATERLHAWSLALLERHGVLTREAVVAENLGGGFPAVYPVLRAMEEAGRIRRGYFVDGLGAAQFALPGAVDRLRALREPGGSDGDVHVLAATDPANPYGAALAWPRRGDDDRRPLARAAGAYVVIVDGEAALYVDRGGGSFQSLPAADDPAVADTGDPRPGGSRRGGAAAGARRDPRGRTAHRGNDVARAICRGRLRSGLSRPRAPGRAARNRGDGSISHDRRRSSASTGGRTGVSPPSVDDAPVPEGDTLRRTADGLRPHLARPDGHRRRRLGPRARGPSCSSAGASRASRRVGKHLLIRFDSGLELRTHLGMHGELASLRPRRAVAAAGGPRPSRAGGARGGRGLFRRPASSSSSRHGPSRCIRCWAGWARTCSQTNSTRRRRSGDSAIPRAADLAIADALLDQEALAGIGNVYKNEVLWIEGVDPFASVASLDDATLTRLVATARLLMLRNVGTERRDTTGGDRRGRRFTPVDLRQNGASVPALRDDDRGTTRRGTAAGDVLVPGLSDRRARRARRRRGGSWGRRTDPFHGLSRQPA